VLFLKEKKIFLLLLLVLGIFAGLHFSDSELVYYGGDESRHFMNGVFYKDMLAEGGFKNPAEYLMDYYFQYPALSVYQYPPLFYLLEAAVFAVFGANKLPVLFLILLITIFGVYYFYQYVRNKFGESVAFLSALVFITSKIFLRNFDKIMLDLVSLSAVMICLFYLDKYHFRKNKKALIISTLFMFFAVLMELKSATIIFVFFYFIIHDLMARRFRFSQKTSFLIMTVVFSSAIIAFATFSELTRIPFFYRTLHGYEMVSIFDISKMAKQGDFFLLFRKFQLITTFGVTLLSLSLVGIFMLIKKRELEKVIVYSVFSCLYLVIFFLIESSRFAYDRFNLFLLPIVSILSALAISGLIKIFNKNNLLNRGIYCGAVLAFILTGIFRNYAYFKGYDPAAQEMMLTLTKSNAPILIDAYLDGTFIAYMRAHDPARKQIIFRGDKVLYSANLYLDNIEKTHIADEEDILNILDELRIEYILVDDLYREIPQKNMFRNFLETSDKIEYIKTFPVDTNISHYKSTAQLTLYRYLDNSKDFNKEVEIFIGAGDITIKRNLEHFLR